MAVTDRVDAPAADSAVERLKEHLRDPMQRDGYALVAGSLITSGLGMVFWLVAARRYAPEQIGIASALISVMGFLANLATLGLRNGLIRFLPVTREPARLIARAYLACALTAALAAGVFVVGQPWWAGRLELVRGSPGAVLLFVAATVAWLLFVLQDAVLTGLREARWVPVENAAYAVVKLILLVAITAASPWGLFLAWIVPAVVLIPLVNLVIVRGLRRVDGEAATEPSLGPLVRFAAADHSSSLLWLGTTELVPLLVLALTGPAAGGVYYLAFTIAYTLYLFTSNVSSAFVIQASLHPEREGELMRRALLQAGRIVIPAAILGTLLAPYILRLLGPEYESTGTPLLRLLLLSAIPQIVVGVSLGRARVRQNLRLVLGVYITVFVSVVTGTYVGVEQIGLVAVGWTWLIVQSVLAGMLLGPAKVAGRALSVVLGLGFRLRTAPRAMKRRRTAARLVAAALTPSGEIPRSVRVLRSDNDVLVSLVEAESRSLVVKVATAPAGDHGLERNAESINRIRRDPRCRSWRHLPELLDRTRVEDRQATVESKAPGTPLARMSGARRADAVAAARTALAELHTITSESRMLDETWMQAHVDERIELLRQVPALTSRVGVLEAVRAELHRTLTSSAVTVSMVHGDAWAGNVLVDHGAEASCQITFVDWEDSRPDGLPDVDTAHFLLNEQPGELGAAVVRAIRRPQDWPGATGEGTTAELASGLPVRTVILLTWLGHITAGLARTTEIAPSRFWLRRNVIDVLDALLEAPVKHPRRHASRRWSAPRITGMMLVISVGLWVYGFAGQDPRAMTDLGLVSLMGPAVVAAFLIIVASFVYAWGRNLGETWLGLPLVVFILLVHGTPAVFFDTLRYAWAWKHVGIVDYIERHGAVDTNIPGSTQIYHSWPGFFTGGAMLDQLAGAGDAIGLATWAPVVFNLANLIALRYLLGALTRDRQRLWLALWLFTITNWIGQDYYSPQAMAYVLHLLTLGLVLHHFRRGVSRPVQWRAAAGPLMAFALMSVAIASSHQITPLMLVVTLAALVVLRVIPLPLTLAAAAIVAVWAATVGKNQVRAEASSLSADLFQPVANAEQTLSKMQSTLPEQILVSWAGRGVVLLVASLAAVGVVRLWRGRQLDRAVLALAASPGIVPVVTSFGGEVIFRVYLFALPALSLLAASAISSPEPASTRRPRQWTIPSVGWVASLAAALCSLVLLSGFVLAYYGKDRQYSFTNEEVTASRWVAQHGVPNSLLVVASRNYPGAFLNYEWFTDVAIDREETSGITSITSNPARLDEWLDDPRYAKGFILLTRSQRIDVETNGTMPPGSYRLIEDTLRSSSRFRIVFENRDAVVFELARSSITSSR